MNPLHSGWLTLRFVTLRTSGRAGVIGMLLALAGVLSLPTLERHWRQETRALHQDTRRVLRDFGERARTAKPVPQVAEQLRNFHAWFPDVRRNADDLRLLLNEAAKDGIALDKGEYRMTRNATAGFLNYEVVLPIKAAYPEIRGFIAGVLNAAPHASLAELRMERPAADSKSLDAKVHFTFIYQEE